MNVRIFSVWDATLNGPATAGQAKRLGDESGLAAGEVTALPLGSSVHPLAPFAGMLRGDPLVEPWKQAMAEYRDQKHGAPDTP